MYYNICIKESGLTTNIFLDRVDDAKDFFRWICNNACHNDLSVKITIRIIPHLPQHSKLTDANLARATKFIKQWMRSCKLRV